MAGSEGFGARREFGRLRMMDCRQCLRCHSCSTMHERMPALPGLSDTPHHKLILRLGGCPIVTGLLLCPTHCPPKAGISSFRRFADCVTPALCYIWISLNSTVYTWVVSHTPWSLFSYLLRSRLLHCCAPKSWLY